MSDEKIAAKLSEVFKPKAQKPPTGTVCTGCSSDNITLYRAVFSGPYGGMLKCEACGLSESVISHLGKTCFIVEPLSPEDMKDD